MQFISTTSYYSHESKMRLTDKEWDELLVLKEAITYSPSTVHPSKMERFSELFTRTLPFLVPEEGSPEPSCQDIAEY